MPTHRRKAATAPRRKARRATTRHHAPTRSTRRSTKAAPKRRRSYSRRPKGFLGEIISQANAMQGGNAIIMGGLAGTAGHSLMTHVFPTLPKAGRVGILGGLSFLMATIMKAPMFAAGLAAVAAIDLISGTTGVSEKNMALAERGYLQENYLSQLPETLSDGYLSDGYLSDAAYGTEDASFMEM